MHTHENHKISFYYTLALEKNEVHCFSYVHLKHNFLTFFSGTSDDNYLFCV